MKFFTFSIFTLTLVNLSATAGASQLNSLFHPSHHMSAESKEAFFISGSMKLEILEWKKKSIQSPSKFKKLACKFPARFNQMHNERLIDTKFDTKKCSNLAKLYSDKHSRLSLVFAEDKLHSAASSFGHVFLVFHNEENPELDAMSFFFTAETQPKISPFSYIYKGLSGGFEGKFAQSFLAETADNYLNKEQRSLHFYELNVTENEIVFLKEHIYELQNIKFKYYFTNNNCVDLLFSFLSILPNFRDEAVSRYPFSVPKSFVYKNRENILKHTKKTTPYKRLTQLTNKIKDKKKLKNITRGERVLLKTDSEPLKSLVYDYYSYLFKYKEVSPPNYSQNLMASNPRILVDEQIVMEDYSRPYSIEFNQNFNLEKKSQTNQSIRYRLLYKDFFSFQNSWRSPRELKIGEIDLSVSPKPELNELVLYSIRSLTPSNSLVFEPNQDFYLGVQKRLGSRKLRMAYGLGYTLNSLLPLNFGFRTAFLSNFEIDPIYSISPTIKLFTRNKNIIFFVEASQNFYSDGLQFLEISADLRMRLKRGLSFGFGYSREGQDEDIISLSLRLE